jgi:hypothetical protein
MENRPSRNGSFAGQWLEKMAVVRLQKLHRE